MQKKFCEIAWWSPLQCKRAKKANKGCRGLPSHSILQPHELWQKEPKKHRPLLKGCLGLPMGYSDSVLCILSLKFSSIE